MKKIFLLLSISTILLFATNYTDGINFYKKKQYKQAMDQFLIASKHNDNQAMLAIGIMYANGDGVKKDQNRSIDWFKKSAKLGNIYALNKLGNYYASKEDFKNAFIYFEQAAKKGDAKASYNLGYFYTGGLGVKMDLKKSLYWYEQAASAGNIDAQLNAGFMYIAGQGTKKDYKKAAFWIKKAKDVGNEKAITLWHEFKLKDYE